MIAGGPFQPPCFCISALPFQYRPFSLSWVQFLGHLPSRCTVPIPQAYHPSPSCLLFWAILLKNRGYEGQRRVWWQADWRKRWGRVRKDGPGSPALLLPRQAEQGFRGSHCFLRAWPPLLATRPADSWVSRRQSLGIQSTPHTTAPAPYLPSHVHRIHRHIPANEMSTKCLLKSAMTKWYLYYYDTSQVLKKEFLLCSGVRGAFVADIHQLFSFQLSKWPFIASDSWTSRGSFLPFMGNCSFFLLSFSIWINIFQMFPTCICAL